MSNDKLFNISNGYMPHCGINGWDVLMERREEPDRRYLANLASAIPDNRFCDIYKI
jgi:catechol-2,3-dioxygenase